MARKLYPVQKMTDFVQRYFMKLGVPKGDAEKAADILLAADLRGVDSHGVIRLSTYYGSGLLNGIINPTPDIKTIAETPSTLRLDGDSGLGQVVSYHAMKRCIEKAREVGSATVAVGNSNHYGIAGYYAMMALEEDMIGISYTNAHALVAPTYGRSAMLGTNPIAIAVPAGKEEPYVLDMATSIVPIGRITVYQKAGQQIPLGWGINPEGEITSDPTQVLSGGALMPLGGPDTLRGYKGYGLAMMVEIFSGILTGTATLLNAGHKGKDMPANVGHFFQAFRVDAFQPPEEFKAAMDQFLRYLHDAPKAAGHDHIYVPGEKEFANARKYSEIGIPLMDNVVEMLKQAAETAGVEFGVEPTGEWID